MKKSFPNEVIKRKFLQDFKERKGFSKSSVDAYERDILLWQKCHNNKDFASFGIKQAICFKEWIKNRADKNGKKLSLTYIYNVLRRLRGFFEWLSMQPGYKSKIDKKAIEYLSLSKEENRIALAPNKHRIPTIEDIIKVIESIKIRNDIDKRDRALICFTFLTGARISAIYSLPMKAFDEDKLIIDQNPKLGVHTKRAKHIPITFFPLKHHTKVINYFLEWYKYLKYTLNFREDDPIFPKGVIKNGQENISYYTKPPLKSRVCDS